MLSNQTSLADVLFMEVFHTTSLFNSFKIYIYIYIYIIKLNLKKKREKFYCPGTCQIIKEKYRRITIKI